MASRKQENSKAPELQINGEAVAGDNRYAEDQVPESCGRVSQCVTMDIPGLTEHQMSDAIDKVMDVNRRLVQKIEILHMKVEVDSKDREIKKNEIQETGKQLLAAKEMEVKHLKSDLEKKKATVKKLSKENQQKEAQVQRLEQYVADLRKDVDASKKFADDIQCQLDAISAQPDAQSIHAGTENRIEMVQLRKEVNSLKEHLATLENELKKANGKIVEQQGMIRLMEHDKSNIQQKFQDDLQKVQTVVMREIESLRDAMNRQWREMRDIRNQNAELQQLVAGIKDMVFAPSRQASPTDAVSSIPSLPPVVDNQQKGSRGKKP
ncbi:hypothetical protein BsWGS_02359 [Bradybaena similaris]